ncbi:hypothetical protein [Streptomyces sp. AK02-01A]|uniref:COG4315 family predicted lipoprotein n=1 Tax=Streptomyces sp. AK02-01A TaxID=3028648 RepID=UPI0029B22813|nr:hypothetical protein [Streptomyces sp. AK02-01A]MDX3854553.1 hypothetical protein [Streptomyces sp. AK02-01A]
MRSNTRTAAAVAAAVLCAAALAGCSDSGGSGSASKRDMPADFAEASASQTPSASSSAPARNPNEISVASGPLGQILVDSKGHTLYLFEADTRNKSTCSGDCAVDWPPQIVTGQPKAGKGGVDQTLLSTATRSDGKKQVTYRGHPLYRFEADKKPGETRGQGLTAFGAKWYVIDPAGNRVTKPQPSPTGSPSPTGASPTESSPSASSY